MGHFPGEIICWTMSEVFMVFNRWMSYRHLSNPNRVELEINNRWKTGKFIKYVEIKQHAIDKEGNHRIYPEKQMKVKQHR